MGLTFVIEADYLQLVHEADPVVVVYADAHFQGASQTLTPGRYDMADLTIPNDSISSIAVNKGLKVTLFGDAGFSGGQITIDSDIEAFGPGINDAASSLIVETV